MSFYRSHFQIFTTFSSFYYTGLDERGEQIYFETSDFLARIIQHEMDHLEGVMFTDIMNPKTLKNPLWKEINELNGFVELNYFPKA